MPARPSRVTPLLCHSYEIVFLKPRGCCSRVQVPRLLNVSHRCLACGALSFLFLGRTPRLEVFLGGFINPAREKSLLQWITRFLQVVTCLHLSGLDIKFSTRRNMCEYTKHYWVYTGCIDPGAHYFKTSLDGRKDKKCKAAPHERYIVVEGKCPLCP